MPKLSAEDKFLDLSDYGRTSGAWFARQLVGTWFTPIHVTLLFGVCGLVAIFFIFKGYYILAGLFLILKSIIDAADGELARLKKTPSYTGRYLDSVFDIILNFILVFAISKISHTNLWIGFLAFFCIELQGTLYNYYYVILRNKMQGGDTTSKIFEYKTPTALPGESQKWVKILFVAYYFCYGLYDRIIHILDHDAYKVQILPSWFMTCVSIYGLGFQLLVIAIMLALHLVHFILPFFIFFTIFMFILIVIRKLLIPA